VVDVFMPLTRLYRGMRQVPLELTLRNVSSQSVEARTIALLGDLVASPTEGVRFGEFDPPAGQALEPDALVVVRFYGRVDEDAAAPSADAIPLQINERAAEGGVSVRLAEGIEIPQFELIEVQRLIVDTSEDTASGRNQSLRAALSLANTMGGGPIVVSFAGEDFEGLDPRPITIGNLPLPKIQTNDLQIDGNGVQVEIVGQPLPLGDPRVNPVRHGLHIAGSRVVLRGITVAEFRPSNVNGQNEPPDGQGPTHGLLFEQGSDLRIVDVTFRACGANHINGGQVRLRRGAGHVVYDTRFVRGGRDGLRLESDTTDARVVSNQLYRNYDDGVSARGPRHQIWHNDFRGVSGGGDEYAGGVETRDTSDLALMRNRFEQYRYGVRGSAGTRIRIVENVFSESLTRDVDMSLSESTAAIAVLANRFSGSVDRPVRIAQGNGQMTPVPVFSVTADGVAAGAPLPAPGQVEIYRRDAGHYWPLATVEVMADRPWALELPASLVGAELYALYTTVREASGELAAASGSWE
jgi:hypothetical protein